MMIGAIVDPSAQVVAIVLTALEEAAFRSTMVARDTFIAWLFKGREMTGAELEQQRSVWAACSASSMYIEIVSIITCRVMYVAFHQHRFVVNFGYSSGTLAGISAMVVAAFGEIVFEVVVDAFALDVESRNGIDLDQFWSMWRKNPGESRCSFVGTRVCYAPTFTLLLFFVLCSHWHTIIPLLLPITIRVAQLLSPAWPCQTPSPVLFALFLHSGSTQHSSSALLQQIRARALAVALISLPPIATRLLSW